MRTIRKQAIDRARHLTRMGTIEIGDTVEVIKNSWGGYDIGTIADVIEIKVYKNSLIHYVFRIVSKNENRTMVKEVGLGHPMEDIKLIKKGSN